MEKNRKSVKTRAKCLPKPITKSPITTHPTEESKWKYEVSSWMLIILGCIGIITAWWVNAIMPDAFATAVIITALGGGLILLGTRNYG